MSNINIFIDDILASGGIPRITDVVDCSKYKYVWSGSQYIRAGDWLIEIPHGFLSDGATGVPDRCPAAFWPHDRLYVSPWAWRVEKRVRVSRYRADMIYAMQGWRARVWTVYLEGLALAVGVGIPAWRHYRKQDDEINLLEHMIPRSMCWEFRTQYTKDAVWKI